MTSLSLDQALSFLDTKGVQLTTYRITEYSCHVILPLTSLSEDIIMFNVKKKKNVCKI